MAESSPSPPRDSEPATARCPRCGGVGEKPKRRQVRNPFLSKTDPRARVCADCGLDFAADTDEPPSSGEWPW